MRFYKMTHNALLHIKRVATYKYVFAIHIFRIRVANRYGNVLCIHMYHIMHVDCGLCICASDMQFYVLTLHRCMRFIDS